LQPEKIAKKIRENLVEQKAKLEEYLSVLEHESKDIKSKSADRLSHHINVEKSIIHELSQLKLILKPLEVMYESSTANKDSSLAGLKSMLDKLSKDVTEKAALNQNELEIVLNELRSNIKTVRTKTGFVNQAYAANASHHLDISG
jgi:hypothetical protein